MEYVYRFIVAGLLFAAIDAIWLSVVANKLYRQELSKILIKKPRLRPAILFYVIYLIGLVVFVLTPALNAGLISYAYSLGVLYGLVCYATYDLTNLSTLKDFSRKIAVVDIIWGTVLTGVVSTLTFIVFQH